MVTVLKKGKVRYLSRADSAKKIVNNAQVVQKKEDPDINRLFSP